ncbi:MAG TPA: DNA topoisomerase I [Candidatus Nanoarchaeia archaeon]|nr:DNA topoisomerase I [Candidatus Nanoarchaeia archaeon]
MPKKDLKTREEKASEEYFPVEENFKRFTEKPIKESIPENKMITEKQVKSLVTDIHSIEKEFRKPEKKDIEKVEIVSKRRTRKKRKTKSSRTTTKEVKYTAPKINLQDKGYELIITEKPQAAAKIASALGRATKSNYQKIPYYEVDRQGKKIVVTSAVGHLFTLSQTSAGRNIPEFGISWVPNFKVRKGDFSRKYYETILKLCKNAGSLTVATDYDVEGEVIGLNIVRFLCGQKDASRMKFSTLTSKELNDAYENKKSTLNWNQGIAGETRHYLDWFYGINLSRALMRAIKAVGKFKIMSIGRVQGPSLNLIVQREREIQNFKPEQFFQAFITVDDGKNKLELKYIKDIFDKKDLKRFEKLTGKKALAVTNKTQQTLPPNPPFNLTTLQTEAYKLYSITPSQTLKIAQGLYLAGLISYPRTSSQKLPAAIGYKDILDKIAKRFKAESLIKRSKPVEGEKSDPAHPSIYPTGEFQVLTGQDEKIYNLIARRFLALFCENAIIDRKTVKANPVDDKELVFSTSGAQIVKKAWLSIYPRKTKELEIPDMNGEVDIIDSRTEEKETQPPKRYSPASILSELEKRNLGTKATRASILETLYDRGYIQDQSIKATPLGMSLIATLEKHSPIIIDEDLTRDFENDMTGIEEAKKSNISEEEEKILDKAKKTITKITTDFGKEEKEIGNELVDANVAYREQQKIENRLSLCPKCKKGYLTITYSKKNKKFFVACDAYPECKNTFSLPPRGTIKKTEKTCEECGFPIMMSLMKGKKPWFFCFNPECPSNKKRIEEYRKKQEESQ